MANHHDAHAHDDHRPDVGLYLKVFGALMLLTVVTVAISRMHFSRPVAIGLGLAVAFAKASLVCAVFMHLWGENTLIHKLLIVTIAGALGFLIPLADGAWSVTRMTGRVPVAGQHPDKGHAGGEPHPEGTPETMTLPKGGH